MKLGKIFDSVTRIAGAVAIVVAIVVFLAMYVVPSSQTRGCGCSFAPPHSDTAVDQKLVDLKARLQGVRTYLEVYRLRHHGAYPTDIDSQLTSVIDMPEMFRVVDGVHVSFAQGIPTNPFIDDPVRAVKTSGQSGDGWSYDPVTGVFVANTPGHGGL